MKIVAPSIKETAFNCPHCGAFTTQQWYSIFLDRKSGERRLPLIPDYDFLVSSIKDDERIDDDRKEELRLWASKMALPLPFQTIHSQSNNLRLQLENAWASTCYNCEQVALWVKDTLIFPAQKSGKVPNPDLPDEIKVDFEEARAILDKSPRGAAALLRLAIQKLCKHLGGQGNNIDADIAFLVGKGLDPTVQEALDVVRVIGNESVHPGTIDLNDDRATAEGLFDLVNIVVEKMISYPNSVRRMYERLPQKKLDGIERRDKHAARQNKAPAKKDD